MKNTFPDAQQLMVSVSKCTTQIPLKQGIYSICSLTIRQISNYRYNTPTSRRIFSFNFKCLAPMSNATFGLYWQTFLFI